MQNALLFFTGLAALIVGATLLVRGASGVALSFGISPLVVGLTIVAFGTSAPEMGVSISAALAGQSDLAVGNVVGSNIFNVLFILGISALIIPLEVNLQIIRQEVPVMIFASVLLLLMSLDGGIGKFEGAFLFVLLLVYTVVLVRQSRHQSINEGVYLVVEQKPASESAWDKKLPVQLALIATGLIALVWGSESLVTTAVIFAQQLGVSDLVIGLTIVAAGTSMPELATSITAALKGERDIAVGNVIGSNTFNILGCLGATGLISSEPGLLISSAVLGFDIWVMLAVAVACLPVFMIGREISRWNGVVFLGYYGAYVVYLILASQQPDALPQWRFAMLGLVMLITLTTILAMLLSTPRSAQHT